MQVQCRCGAIKIEVLADPVAQFFCHCDDCQAAHGAAYVPESAYAADALVITEGSASAWTVKRNQRFFCPTCGTKLFIDIPSVGLRGLNGHLLPAGAFEPQFHMHCSYAVLPVRDGLPHYKSWPPRFLGSGEVVAW